MKEDLQKLALAFLAARCPAAYTAAAVAARVNDSGLTDAKVSETHADEALRVLQRNGYAQSEVEPAPGTRIYWSATPEGVSAWNAAGRLYVGR